MGHEESVSLVPISMPVTLNRDKFDIGSWNRKSEAIRLSRAPSRDNLDPCTRVALAYVLSVLTVAVPIGGMMWWLVAG